MLLSYYAQSNTQIDVLLASIQDQLRAVDRKPRRAPNEETSLSLLRAKEELMRLKQSYRVKKAQQVKDPMSMQLTEQTNRLTDLKRTNQKERQNVVDKQNQVSLLLQKHNVDESSRA